MTPNYRVKAVLIDMILLLTDLVTWYNFLSVRITRWNSVNWDFLFFLGPKCMYHDSKIYLFFDNSTPMCHAQKILSIKKLYSQYLKNIWNKSIKKNTASSFAVFGHTGSTTSHFDSCAPLFSQIMSKWIATVIKSARLKITAGNKKD